MREILFSIFAFFLSPHPFGQGDKMLQPGLYRVETTTVFTSAVVGEETTHEDSFEEVEICLDEQSRNLHKTPSFISNIHLGLMMGYDFKAVEYSKYQTRLVFHDTSYSGAKTEYQVLMTCEPNKTECVLDVTGKNWDPAAQLRLAKEPENSNFEDLNSSSRRLVLFSKTTTSYTRIGSDCPHSFAGQPGKFYETEAVSSETPSTFDLVAAEMRKPD